jgi:dTMP kinase
MSVFHVLIEAIDGAGKGTVIRGLTEHFANKALPILRVCEPAHHSLGSIIRDELIKKHADGRTYPGKMIAEAYAIDRAILFNTSILPFKLANPRGIILQDRGLFSSLTYQPLQDPTLGSDFLLSLEGNQLELNNPPTVLLILNLSPETAAQRLAGRTEKNDQSVFEEGSFQDKLINRYQDEDLRKIYKNKGVTVIDINAEQTPEKVLSDAINILEPLFCSL